MRRDRNSLGDESGSLIGLAGGELRAAPYSGTKALMLAVLEDAIRTYLNRQDGGEAELWIFGRQRRSVFSFVVVCETLGLEPNAVRAALRRLDANEGEDRALRRSRPNVRGRGPKNGTDKG